MKCFINLKFVLCLWCCFIFF